MIIKKAWKLLGGILQLVGPFFESHLMNKNTRQLCTESLSPLPTSEITLVKKQKKTIFQEDKNQGKQTGG